MTKTTKILFRLYGAVWWLDKNDQRCYFYIPKTKSLYRWAYTQREARFRFKKILFDYLKKQSPQNYPLRFAHIVLEWTKIEEVKKKQITNQKQLNLFKRIKRKLS